jgi:hypothetical protein
MSLASRERRIAWVRGISLFLASALLAINFGMAGLWFGAAASLVYGLLVWFMVSRQASDTGHIWLIGYLLFAALGINLGLSIPLMLGAVVFALAFWDTDFFLRKLNRVRSAQWKAPLENAHLLRLAITLSTGLVISLVGLIFQTDLGLGWAMLIGLVIFISLRLGIGVIHDDTNKG